METKKEQIPDKKIQREDIHRRGGLILEKARMFLRETPLVLERPWDRADIERIRAFFVEAAPFAHHEVFPDFWEHSLLAAIYARKLAESAEVGELDPSEAEALALCHDLGRLVVPSEYGLNDIVAELAAKRIGIKKDETGKEPPLARILGVFSPAIRGVFDLSVPQRLLQVADYLGRFKKGQEDKVLITTEDLPFLSSRGYRDSAWAIARASLRALRQPGKEEWVNSLVVEDVRWLQKEFGIDFGKLRDEVLAEFNRDDNQRWLLSARHAQESLNRDIDIQLGRPKIKFIVFDVGGVLIETIEPDLEQLISRQLNLDTSKVHEAFSIFYSKEMMAAEITEEKLLKMFLGRLGVSMTSMEDLRGLFAHPEICKSTAGMQNLIADIANKSEITLMVFSDSILPLAKSVSGGVLALYPRLSPDRVFISSVLKSSKMGGDAYAKILEQFGNPDPQTVLFVDDKLTYSSAARIKFNMRGFTFEGDAAKGEASAQRLKRELASAQIL